MEKESSPLSQNENGFTLSNTELLAINEALDNDQLLAVRLLSNLHYADLADLIDSTSSEKRFKIINIISENFAPDIIAHVLIELVPSVRNQIINMFDNCSKLFEAMDIDQAVYVIKDFDENKQKEILKSLPIEIADSIKEGLSYPENSAGRIMRKQFVAIPDSLNVGEIICFLRGNKSLPLEFNEIYVINDQSHPIGSVQVSRVINSEENVHISNLIKKNIKVILPTMDQEEVSYICRQYSLVSAPVVDNNGKMIGVISIDDVLEVIEEEAEEDFMRMAGVNEIDLHAAFLDTVKHRFPWLFINLLTACGTSLVINLFHSTIHNMVALAAIMPIVASMGGNAGTQSLTVIVRAIAHRDLTMINKWRVILKEVLTNCFNGFFLSIFGGIVILIINNDFNLSLVFAAAVIINFTMAGFLGAFIPLTLSRMRVDPATASGVFLTALTDMIGFFAFLGLASVFL